jgi:hypothetical protein
MNDKTPAPHAGGAVSGDRLLPRERRVQTPATAVTHYVTEFDLYSAKGDLADAYQTVVQTINAWCKRKQQNPVFACREEIFGATTFPVAWALHTQHRQDGTEGFRRFWYVDVGFNRNDVDRYRVRVTVSHSLDFGFMGWAPPPPEPSVPGFVLEWLVDLRLKIRSGVLPMAAIAAAKQGSIDKPRERIRAMKVDPNAVGKLKQIVFDPQRGLPIVFIAGELNPVTFPLVPDTLQQRLLGTCYIVWAPPAPGWASAWNKHFPQGYACRGNSVRIYQPGAAPDRPLDSYRHRYFSDDEIRRHGSDEFISMIRDGFTRRMLVPYYGRIANCEDVRLLRAEEDFNVHRSKLTTKEEEIALYEFEYPRLLEQKNLSDQLLAESDAEKKRIADELASLRPHAQSLAEQLEEMKRSASSTPNAPDHSDMLSKVMRGELTVCDYLQVIGILAPEAVEVLPSAIKSAQSMKQFEYLADLRDLLWILVTRYRQALLDGKGDHEACRVFGRKDYATRESDNLSKEGLRARTFEFNGREVVMEQHIKIGIKDSEARCLRLHFLWDVVSGKIVIGHCGKHLPL